MVLIHYIAVKHTLKVRKNYILKLVVLAMQRFPRTLGTLVDPSGSKCVITRTHVEVDSDGI
jgi:hypothetical protein